MQKVLYTAQNAHWRVGYAKSALYGAKSALYGTKCTLKIRMCKKCSIRHKTHAGEWDVQKVLYMTQNVRSRL